MSEAWRQLGTPRIGGVLLIGDHASAHVPDDIDLGIDLALLREHIAIDVGVAEVAALLVEAGAVDAAILGGVSRLVVDCNRDEEALGALPIVSDGHAIPGNAVDHSGREARMARFFRPYHAHIAEAIAAHRPGMILSLHSFTPALASDPEQQRPWHVGVLYNEDDRLAAPTIAALGAEGLTVGVVQGHIIHQVCLAGEMQDRRGEEAQVGHGARDIHAPGQCKGFAVIARFVLGEPVEVILDQLSESEQNGASALPSHGVPRGKGTVRGFNSGVHITYITVR